MAIAAPRLLSKGDPSASAQDDNHRPHPEQAGPNHSIGIAAIVAAAVALTVWVGPEPTGTAVVDIIYSVGFAIAVTIGAAFASPRLRRWAAAVILVALCVAALDAGSLSPLPWAALSAVAVGLAFAIDTKTVGATIGAATVASLWHIAPLGVTGVPAVVTLVAVGPLVAVAVGQLRNRRRLLWRFATQVVIVGVIWTVIAAGWTLYSSRPSIDQARDASRNAEQLFGEGRVSGALAEATVAARHASGLDYRLGQWWNKGLFAVPVMAQNLRAGSELFRTGRSVLEFSLPVANEGISVRHADGRIDAGGIQALTPWVEPLTRQASAAANRVGSVESVWLVDPLADAITATEQLGAAVDDRGDALANVFSVAPELLGADDPKRYLVLFMTPVEARELEGLVGNWALLIVDDGLVHVERVGRIKDLNSRASGEGFADPDSYPTRYQHYRVEQYFQNVTASPDFPTVARAASEIFPQMGGVAIDGVAAVDPFAIGALVSASGPITIPGFDGSFDGDRVTQFLLFDQYRQLPDLQQREIVLDTLTRNAFASLLKDGVGRPDRLLDAFAEPIEERRLLFTTFDETTNDALDTFGVRGVFPAPSDDFETLSVRHDSAVARKIDGYIQRKMSVVMVPDPDQGQSKLTVEVTLTNDTPYGLLPYVAGTDEDYEFPDGSALAPNDHLLRLSLYTSAALESVDVRNEAPSPQVPDHYTEEEYDYFRHFVWVVVRQGESTTVTFELASPYAPAPQDRVAIRVIPQPLVNDDIWRFAATWDRSVGTPDGTRSIGTPDGTVDPEIRRVGPGPIDVPTVVVLPAPQ